MNNMELLANALEYMESHLGEDIHTEDVARACYCSKSTLEKLFRCVNEITVREYLIQRRMTKAARVISAQPEKGILEIALQYGYSTNESFTHVIFYSRIEIGRERSIWCIYRGSGFLTETGSLIFLWGFEGPAMIAFIRFRYFPSIDLNR